MPGRVDGLLPPQGPQRSRQSETKRTGDAANRPDSASTSDAADSLKLSTAARETRQIESRLQEAVDDVPDIREDRVAQARARIASGEYDNENVRRIIADRILSQLGIE